MPPNEFKSIARKFLKLPKHKILKTNLTQPSYKLKSSIEKQLELTFYRRSRVPFQLLDEVAANEVAGAVDSVSAVDPDDRI